MGCEMKISELVKFVLGESVDPSQKKIKQQYMDMVWLLYPEGKEMVPKAYQQLRKITNGKLKMEDIRQESGVESQTVKKWNVFFERATTKSPGKYVTVYLWNRTEMEWVDFFDVEENAFSGRSFSLFCAESRGFIASNREHNTNV